MTPKERAAMQQALEALEELFHSNSTKVAVEKYNIAHNALLEALVEPQVDWYEEAMRLAGLNAKNVGELRKLEAEQAEQEPIAKEKAESYREGYMDGRRDSTLAAPQPVKQEPVAWFVQYKNRHEFVFGSKPEFIVDGVVEPLYAAPVRTKDLTDDEIADIRMSIVAYEPVEWGRVFARAVIAADREKNK